MFANQVESVAKYDLEKMGLEMIKKAEAEVESIKIKGMA